ncbi:hypothetical protein HX052_06375 [Myroides marinus]|uniref:hypothetical protein n=2 Tax=Pseudomonadati TaxID=3379134 RepID=UPI0025778C05|nr:hypothetical protein [Myroides marinus]MDM1367839.1 hypothetical protein [Myroides marinus]MDM1373622.1 hypothetical protein [Myroides marinus]MDM1376217.1 hypothetical protein [Myroides marinus]MDM1382283.1 hypothetical protein [Myroides marinus]MDM1389595.1 hypothetical protein [Myroides marinus]
MKKLLFYFFVVLLTVAMGACSKDDNTPDDKVLKDLFVQTSNTTVDIGASVDFIAVDNDRKEVKEVDFFADGVKITKDYKFDKRGVYNVIAKKTGYKNSVPLPIMVGGAIAEKLELVASKDEILIGEQVSFTVSIDGRAVSGYILEHIKVGMLSGDKWSAFEEGTYQFRAFKEGYISSDIVTIKVNKKPIIDNQSFTINGVKYGIEEVLLEGDVVDDNKNIASVFIYTDSNGRKYQKYRLFARSMTTATYTVVEFAVYVSAMEKEFMFPTDVDPKDVVVLNVGAVVDNVAVASLDADKLDVATSKWTTPFEHYFKSPGVVNYQIVSKDKKLQINYEGNYNGLEFSKVKPNTKKMMNPFESKKGRLAKLK